MLDDPVKLRKFVIDNWEKHCANKIHGKKVDLSMELQAHIAGFDFGIFRAKQPLELTNEHSQTKYHLTVFRIPLIDRPAPPQPPSTVAPEKTVYVTQLYEVIAERLGVSVSAVADFANSPEMSRLAAIPAATSIGSGSGRAEERHQVPKR